MILLDATTKKIRVTTGSAISVDFYAAYTDLTSTTFSPGSNVGNITTATTTDVVTAPAASTTRQVKYLSFRNRSATTSQTVTVILDVSSTEYHLTSPTTLLYGESLIYTDTDGWQVLDSTGAKKIVKEEAVMTAINYYKICSSSEGVSARYCPAINIGVPGAWSPGTSGVSGRATNGTDSADYGCLDIPNAITGDNYLYSSSFITTSAGCILELCDFLWVNNGLSVTTTTAQTVNSVALPARDLDESINGRGCNIGLFITSSGNVASPVANSTVSYTNSDGTSGRTATLSDFSAMRIPSSPITGTMVYFQLQSGDVGVKSIESITLGTSLGTGSMSLVIFRVLDSSICTTINFKPTYHSNIKLYKNSCCFPVLTIANSTAITLQYSLTVENR